VRRHRLNIENRLFRRRLAAYQVRVRQLYRSLLLEASSGKFSPGLLGRLGARRVRCFALLWALSGFLWAQGSPGCVLRRVFTQLEQLVLVGQPELLGSEDQAYDVFLPPELPRAVPLFATTDPSRYLIPGSFELP